MSKLVIIWAAADETSAGPSGRKPSRSPSPERQVSGRLAARPARCVISARPESLCGRAPSPGSRRSRSGSGSVRRGAVSPTQPDGDGDQQSPGVREPEPLETQAFPSQVEASQFPTSSPLGGPDSAVGAVDDVVGHEVEAHRHGSRRKRGRSCSSRSQTSGRSRSSKSRRASLFGDQDLGDIPVALRRNLQIASEGVTHLMELITMTTETAERLQKTVSDVTQHCSAVPSNVQRAIDSINELVTHTKEATASTQTFKKVLSDKSSALALSRAAAKRNFLP